MKKMEEVKTKKDFVSFVYELSEDFRNNPESWPNDNLGASPGSFSCMGR